MGSLGGVRRGMGERKVFGSIFKLELLMHLKSTFFDGKLRC